MIGSPEVKCGLCDATKGNIVFSSQKWRVVMVEDKHYPGFCRVIWNEHISEMTDLSDQDRNLIMQIVWKVEQVIRDIMGSHKINLASLGNMVPHVHWHIIPRYTDDPHFPNPIWSPLDIEESDVTEKLKLLPRLKLELETRLCNFDQSHS